MFHLTVKSLCDVRWTWPDNQTTEVACSFFVDTQGLEKNPQKDRWGENNKGKKYFPIILIS